VLFIPSCPGYTNMTVALDRSDRCKSLVGFASGELLDSCVFWVLVLLVSSWSVWSCFVRFCVGFSFRDGCFEVVFVLGTREVTDAFWNACCAAAVATVLTGVVHRSDRCSTGSKPCKFPMCVFICFGSEGCLLVPRSSGTRVATWAWPT
jgi:hypothetical protein